MYTDLTRPPAATQLSFKSMIKDAFFYSIGWFYVNCSEFALRELLEDASPLAELIDSYETVSNWELGLYIYITVVGVWAFFNSMRRAYRQLQNVPVSFLVVVLILSGANCGLMLSKNLHSSKLLLEWLPLVWSESSIVKICALQSMTMSLLLEGLILLVPFRTAFALLSKLFKAKPRV